MDRRQTERPMAQKVSGAGRSRNSPEPGRGADLRNRDRHRRSGGHAAGLLHQRGGACSTGEGHHQHRSDRAGRGVSHCPGNGLLQQLPIADRPGGPAVALPLGRHHQRGPAQLMSSAANGGIGTTGPAMKHQMHQPAATASEQLSGDPLMGPGQITAATSGDHQRTGRTRTWLI